MNALQVPVAVMLPRSLVDDLHTAVDAINERTAGTYPSAFDRLVSLLYAADPRPITDHPTTDAPPAPHLERNRS